MFNFNQVYEKDPQKSLDKARDSVNNGLSGGLAKMFLGQGFVDQMNSAMDQGQAVLNNVNQTNWVAQNGMEASAEVLSVTDTGSSINMNPIVDLSLKVTPDVGPVFTTSARTSVSRIAVPRKGDVIRVKYSPVDPSQIFVVS